jgi:hypothetical protein
VAVPSKVLVRLGDADPTEVRARRDDHRTGNHRSPALLRGRVARAGRLTQGTVARPRPLHNRRPRPNAFPRSRRRWTVGSLPERETMASLSAGVVAARGRRWVDRFCYWRTGRQGSPISPRRCPRRSTRLARLCSSGGEPSEPRRRERRAGGLPTGFRTEASHAKPDDWQRIRRRGE